MTTEKPMTYYYDYVVDAAEEAFDYEQAQFSLYRRGDAVSEKIEQRIDDDVKERMFEGMMREMIGYLFERQSEYQEEHEESVSTALLTDPENVENIYITSRDFECPTVVVEYAEVPEWFTMENADLRVYCWYPDPGMGEETQAAYFQPRQA